MDQLCKYSHSPAHLAVAKRDHAALEEIVSALPRLAKAGAVNTEAESLAAENDADAVSAVIDRRDVHGRETPLHLAVKLRDPISAEILMSAGADWSLQNEKGWNALQEAVCLREENIAKIIVRHYQPLAWAKWCRRLPRIVASASRIRDFYMEITFHFESSVLPFIGKIAPSDTYRIWKRGSNLRADMTLAGFDGLHIQRSDQTLLFLGEGSEGKITTLPPGSLLVMSHREKEITNALEGAGAEPTESEVAREVALMCKTNMYRPGIDVTQSELIPHSNWMRRREKTEMVGVWKAKVYDMLHVIASVKSRRVPGGMTDEELFSVGEDGDCDVLTEEERIQLEDALRGGNSDDILEYEEEGDNYKDCTSNNNNKEKKSWFGWSDRRNSSKQHRANDDDEKKKKKKDENEDNKSKKKKKGSSSSSSSSSSSESEYKKGLRPVLWLTSDFPLRTEELLPLLDILANKVKAVRRLRELLTTKLPPGTFPVKIAVPIVPTIRVVVTFTKFEELQPLEEFSTPPSSPTNFQDAKSTEPTGTDSTWTSWFQVGSRGDQTSSSGVSESCCCSQNETDPFQIPADYAWVDSSEKKRRRKAAKKAKLKKHKKHNSSTNGDKAEA